MTKCNFKFNLKENVKTAFGEKGIIKSMTIDGNGNHYFVMTDSGGRSYNEQDLKPVIDKKTTVTPPEDKTKEK